MLVQLFFVRVAKREAMHGARLHCIPHGGLFLCTYGDKILFSKRVLLQHLPVLTYTGVTHESKCVKRNQSSHQHELVTNLQMWSGGSEKGTFYISINKNNLWQRASLVASHFGEVIYAALFGTLKFYVDEYFKKKLWFQIVSNLDIYVYSSRCAYKVRNVSCLCPSLN